MKSVMKSNNSRKISKKTSKKTSRKVNRKTSRKTMKSNKMNMRGGDENLYATLPGTNPNPENPIYNTLNRRYKQYPHYNTLNPQGINNPGLQTNKGIYSEVPRNNRPSNTKSVSKKKNLLPPPVGKRGVPSTTRGNKERGIIRKPREQSNGPLYERPVNENEKLAKPNTNNIYAEVMFNGPPPK